MSRLKIYIIKKSMEWIKEMYEDGGRKTYHLDMFGIDNIVKKKNRVIVKLLKNNEKNN